MSEGVCWHRPGEMIGKTQTCRDCHVAIRECRCVYGARVSGRQCDVCHGSGYVVFVPVQPPVKAKQVSSNESDRIEFKTCNGSTMNPLVKSLEYIAGAGSFRYQVKLKGISKPFLVPAVEAERIRAAMPKLEVLRAAE